MRLHDKLKTIYLHYHNRYGYRAWQGGDIQQGASFYKVPCPFYHVIYFVILISLTRFVGLEHKRLSRHQLLVLHLLIRNFSEISGNSEQKIFLRP